MDKQAQLACALENWGWCGGGVVPQDSVLETDARCVLGYVLDIKFCQAFQEVVAGEIAVGRPVFYGVIVEGMQVYWACFLAFLDSFDTVVSEHLQHTLPNLQPIQISIHLRILGLDQNPRNPSIRIPLTLMLSIESNNHLNNLIKRRKPKLIIKYGQSAWCLVLLDSQPTQLGQGKLIGPPISFGGAFVIACLVSGGELGKVSDVGYPGQIGIMHHQHSFLLGVYDIELDEIRPLVQCSFECLQSVLREEGAEAAMGDVEGTVLDGYIRGWVWQTLGQLAEGQKEEQKLEGEFGEHFWGCVLLQRVV